MKHRSILDPSSRPDADLLIIPFWEGREAAAPLPSSLERGIAPLLKSKDFEGKACETALSYIEGEKEGRLLLLGLGKKGKLTIDGLRKSYAAAAKVAQGKRGGKLNLLVPKHLPLSLEETIQGIGEGLFLANYAFLELKGEATRAALEGLPTLAQEVGWIGLSSSEETLFHKLLEKMDAVSKGVYFVRDLVNKNADEVTGEMLADLVRSLESKELEVEIFDQKRLEKEGMGLILAVNRASPHSPFLVRLTYRGPSYDEKDHVVLVGKGVTYDTGGLSLKPTDGMLTMKCDMSGAATVLGAVKTAADLKLPIHVTALVPLAENCIGSKSYKLGDVYRSYSGKTVEINNTDAEGRLILADALSYAAKNLSPTCIVDLASLTGAVVIALGEEISGLFVNDESLAQGLAKSSAETGELLWRLPLHPEYKEGLKSEIADLINSGGREASSIKAALFLQEFTESVPWAHIDFAGSCYFTKGKGYHPARATGFGLRLLVDFLERRCHRN